MSKSALKHQITAAALFVSVLVVIKANADAGMNDDWSFILTAKRLAETGKLTYNGWSAPLIGLQAYWGAFFIKLFGFSFFVVRASVMVLTIGGIPVLWRLYREAGAGETQSFFGVLLFLFSPLNLPDLTTFMTDMPAFFFFALALLAALRAWRAERDAGAYRWTALCAICGVVSGSIRQVYWLACVLFLLVLAWKRLQSVKGRIAAGLWIGVTVLFGAVATQWLAEQPHVPIDSTLASLRGMAWPELLTGWSEGLAKYIVSLALLIIPLTLLPRITAKSFHWRSALIAAGAAAVSYKLADPLPWLGNTLTQYGILRAGTVTVGERPVLMEPWLMVTLATIALTLAVTRVADWPLRQWAQADSGTRRIVILTGPFLLAYVGLIVFRGPSFGVYDRYLIPALFLTGLVSLGIWGQRRVPGLAWAVTVAYAVYAAGTTHDYFAEARAKTQAAHEILRAGNKRTDILGGFEFDCWTQASETGFIDNDRLDDSEYVEAGDCNGPESVQIWWRDLTPSVKAQYVLSNTPLAGLARSPLNAVLYRRWIPWSEGRIYVEQVTGARLSCFDQKLN